MEGFPFGFPLCEGDSFPAQSFEVTGCRTEGADHNAPWFFVPLHSANPVLKSRLELVERCLDPFHQQLVQKAEVLVYDGIGGVVVLVGGLFNNRLR